MYRVAQLLKQLEVYMYRGINADVTANEEPHLRRSFKKLQLESDILLTCHRLAEKLLEEKNQSSTLIEEQRLTFCEDFERLKDHHHAQKAQIFKQNKNFEEELFKEYDSSKAQLIKDYEEKLSTLKKQYEKIQQNNEESLRILRDQNESIRKEMYAKTEELKDAVHNNLKQKDLYEKNESLLQKQIQILNRENHIYKQELDSCRGKILKLQKDRISLLEENERLFSYEEGNSFNVQEVESLKAVLELKQKEVTDLRNSLAEAREKIEESDGYKKKVALLQERINDLQVQLQMKKEYEMMLKSENEKLELSIQGETNQRRNISLRNEELEWKLKENKELITRILEQSSDNVFNNSIYLFTSFNNEQKNSNTSLNISFGNFYPSNQSTNSIDSLEVTYSVVNDDSPTLFPKIRGVVQKPYSVSYFLDFHESPDEVASRLTQTSTENYLNQKTAPTDTPSKNRTRMEEITFRKS